MVREVCSLQDFYKTDDIITCHQNKIALFCTAVQCLDLFLLISLIAFLTLSNCSSAVLTFCQAISFSERYQSVPQTSVKVTVSFYFFKYQNFVNSGRYREEVSRWGDSRNIEFSPITEFKLNDMCAISFLQRAVTLAIFMFRFNVMGFCCLSLWTCPWFCMFMPS